MEDLYDKYLLNINQKVKKISYAASFGIDQIPQDKLNIFKKSIDDFDFVSVREDKGKEIINNMLNDKKVEVLIDPTMLLTAYAWEKISKEPKAYKKLNKKKYILNYFLGELSVERKQEIDRIAKENDCIVINMLNQNDPFYECGPSEFVYLEKNAFLICTDSFHSSVFAFLFNRPFVVFDREEVGKNNMGSRIDTLLKKFSLNNRRYNGKNITGDNLNHNYNESFEIREKERKKAYDYLNNALK